MKIHKEMVWNKGVNPKKELTRRRMESICLFSFGVMVRSRLRERLATHACLDGTHTMANAHIHLGGVRTTEIMYGQNCRSKRKAHAGAWTNQKYNLIVTA